MRIIKFLRSLVYHLEWEFVSELPVIFLIFGTVYEASVLRDIVALVKAKPLHIEIPSYI